MSFWKVLGIEPTKNKKEIKRAYARQVKIYHPEEDPENFKRLQDAYKNALMYSEESMIVPQENLARQEKGSSVDNVDIHVQADCIHETQDEKTSKRMYDVNVKIKEPRNVNVQETMPKIPRSETLFRDTGFYQDEKYFEQRDKLLREIELSLPKSFNAVSFSKFMQEPMIQMYLEQEDFKKELEAILCKRKYKGYNQTSEAMLLCIQGLGMHRLEEKIYKDGEQRRTLIFVICITLVVVIKSLIIGL